MKILPALTIVAAIAAFTATAANAYDATSGRSDRAPQDTVTSTATLQPPVAAPSIATPASIAAEVQLNPTLYREHIN